MKRHSIVVVGAVLGSLVLGPGVAVAQSKWPAAPSGPGWITYEVPPGVNPALTTQHAIQGTHNGEGCDFSFTGSLAPGSPPVEENQVALNPSTCQTIYARGPVQQHGGGGQSASQAGEGATTSASGKNDPTAAAYVKTFYEDPVGIDVTSLRNDVEWGYNGSEDTFYKWKRLATWYEPSGWGLNGVGDSPYLERYAAVSDSHADMENNIFCAGFHVWTHYYYKHEVWGGIHGVAHYEWNDEDAGALCVELLSHHVQYGFETPW
jgi:hypothetical protein